MGLPVIATNWSGQTEFLRDDNSYPIPVSSFDRCPAEPHLWWAGIDMPALRRLLRRAHDDTKAKSNGRLRSSARDMAVRFSEDAVAKRVLHLAQEACANRHAPSQRVPSDVREMRLAEWQRKAEQHQAEDRPAPAPPHHHRESGKRRRRGHKKGQGKNMMRKHHRANRDGSRPKQAAAPDDDFNTR